MRKGNREKGYLWCYIMWYGLNMALQEFTTACQKISSDGPGVTPVES